KYFSSNLGNGAIEIDSVCPSFSHNSSAMCGAYGDIKINRGSNMSFEVHFWAVNSFTAIIKVDTEVLKEKFSISSSTFLMVLCNVFKLSFAGDVSVTLSPLSSKYSFHNFLRKL